MHLVILFAPALTCVSSVVLALPIAVVYEYVLVMEEVGHTPKTKRIMCAVIVPT